MALQFCRDKAGLQVFLSGISKPLAVKLKTWGYAAPNANEYIYYVQCCQQLKSYPSHGNGAESGVSFCEEILKSDC